jgi:hypothetical protein
MQIHTHLCVHTCTGAGYFLKSDARPWWHWLWVWKVLLSHQKKSWGLITYTSEKLTLNSLVSSLPRASIVSLAIISFVCNWRVWMSFLSPKFPWKWQNLCVESSILIYVAAVRERDLSFTWICQSSIWSPLNSCVPTWAIVSIKLGTWWLVDRFMLTKGCWERVHWIIINILYELLGSMPQTKVIRMRGSDYNPIKH